MGIPVFAINLEHSAARRELARAAYKAVGVDVIFHTAVDGRAADLTADRAYDRYTRLRRYG